MSLSQKVQAVEEVFSLLDHEISGFKEWSGLACKSGCGKCCLKPDIEATVLEFLPFAHHLYTIGKAEEWLEKIERNESLVCMAFVSASGDRGSCSQYTHRGLICRLFGFSARTNKYAKREFVTCQVIKTEQPMAYADAVRTIEEGGSVPVMNQYYMRLLSIDPDLGKDFYPINEAIKRAIETVLHYYAYRT